MSEETMIKAGDLVVCVDDRSRDDRVRQVQPPLYKGQAYVVEQVGEKMLLPRDMGWYYKDRFMKIEI